MTHRHKLYNELQFPDLSDALRHPDGAAVTMTAKTFCVGCGEEAIVKVTMGASAAREFATYADPVTGAIMIPQKFLWPRKG